MAGVGGRGPEDAAGIRGQAVSDDSVAAEKAALRAEIRARVAALGAEERGREAAAVVEWVTGCDGWRRARGVGLFVPIGDEIPVGALMEAAWKAGKEVALPAWAGGESGYRFRTVRGAADLAPAGRFGIREPRAGCEDARAERLDFVVVPGVAFDPMGRRLGRGKGYYDRLLAGVEGATCGVGYGVQLVPRVPLEAHDIALKLVATARGFLGPAARG